MPIDDHVPLPTGARRRQLARRCLSPLPHNQQLPPPPPPPPPPPLHPLALLHQSQLCRHRLLRRWMRMLRPAVQTMASVRRYACPLV